MAGLPRLTRVGRDGQAHPQEVGLLCQETGIRRPAMDPVT